MSSQGSCEFKTKNEVLEIAHQACPSKVSPQGLQQHGVAHGRVEVTLARAVLGSCQCHEQMSALNDHHSPA